jgi:hypothetical protein
MATNALPTYSHGGGSTAGWPPVNGTVTGGGRPVFIGDQCIENPCMNVFCYYGTAIVVIEGNGGIPDQTGNPPSGEWVDCSAGGYSMVPGQTLSKKLPRAMQYWRTRITSINGATINSYVPLLRTATGDAVSASYPTITSAQSTS